ncbi:uncharacterized protein LOC128182529 [Crassostrea angulata]|uniref:uncharacterized protein LOC128182529 n=1 Tax=Magallana angulata TaxID=2784310 RepID=UPI0022B08B80|nr:uncharacterized protein LOC128182529 [Crassostrea angulata]
MSEYSYAQEAMYVILCRYIGTPTELTIRREVRDMEEIIKNLLEAYFGKRMMISGSVKEGFRFNSSDRDLMFWLSNHKVITDLSQFCVYDPSKHTLILIEDTDTPPGFVRLQLLTPPRDGFIASSVVPLHNRSYISSSKWRQTLLTSVRRNKAWNQTEIHGPCANCIFNSYENDLALCLHSSSWSRLTCYWRDRCTLHNWPPNHVFDEILRNGCHFVPVGSKLTANENELEWRLSFSQAEQKLVYSMSHTQFLCYGLLKIFLKEVINSDTEEPFLCSYFMKTTMFWLIQIGNITWCPNNLLDCFWKCFKFLLYSVHRGVLSNFFIPQNNIFASKLATERGALTRMHLLEQLNGYYKMGLSCLLQSPTIKPFIEFSELIHVCNNPFRSETFSGRIMIFGDLESCLVEEIYQVEIFQKDTKTCYLNLKSIFLLLHESITENQKLLLQKCTADILVQTAFMLLKYSTDCTNKRAYKSHRLISNLLKLAGRVGDVSYLLYLALYYYRICRYEEVVRIKDLVKSKLLKPYLRYNRVDLEIYNDYVEGLSLSKRMKKAWASSVEMLCVLSYYRLGNMSHCLQSLTDLQTLLLNDDGRYVPLCDRDTSWQILGICQHVVGDLHGALQSYQMSLKQEPFHKLQNASIYRIAFILNRFNERN